ncbi:VOC family protein [Streptomyces sp. NPDC005811]|uniref:VOC family protein n=1 Tax=Streptomyces sp. NPDC005811 TaxID=3154565 RepID=UPI0033F11C80
MNAPFDIDHTSFAVHDALGWATRWRRELGAVPVCGEALAEFRYLLLYVGTVDGGGRLELLEPVGPGFLTRFLSARGEGPHHLTFTVPDLAKTVSRVRSLGMTVVGESYEHPPWREAFVLPDSVHGTVIQLAQSDRSYPDPHELVGSADRDPSALPSVAGATDPFWWASLRDTPPGDPVRLGPTHLGSTRTALSRRLFEDVLGARGSERDGFLELVWPSGSIRVHAAATPGITGVGLLGGPARRLGAAPGFTRGGRSPT